MTEYGLFNDEGCVERQFYSYAQAERALAQYSEEDELRIAAMCSEHEEQEADNCEECSAEEEE